MSLKIYPQSSHLADHSVSPIPPTRIVPHAIFPDSIQSAAPPLQKYPHPPCCHRLAASFGLLLVHVVTGLCRLISCMIAQFTPPCKQTQAYRETIQATQSGNRDQLHRVLRKHAQEKHVAGFILREFSYLPETHDHLRSE